MCLKPLAEIISDEEGYPKEMRYTPCVACLKIKECDVECLAFKNYVRFHNAKTRKENLIATYNRQKLKIIVNKLNTDNDKSSLSNFYETAMTET